LNRFRTPIMKVKTIQSYLNRFNTCQGVSMIRFKIFWIDSDAIRFKKIMKRFIPSQRLLVIRFITIWIDSKAWNEGFICKNDMQDTKDTIRHGFLDALTSSKYKSKAMQAAHSSSTSFHWGCYTCLVQYNNMFQTSKLCLPNT